MLITYRPAASKPSLLSNAWGSDGAQAAARFGRAKRASVVEACVAEKNTARAPRRNRIAGVAVGGGGGGRGGGGWVRRLGTWVVVGVVESQPRRLG
jgi:hypothetical protein